MVSDFIVPYNQSVMASTEEETRYSTALLYSGVLFHFLCEPMCSEDQKKNQSHEVAEGFMASDLCLICLERVSDSHLESKRKHHSV